MAENKGSSLQASLAKIHAIFAKFCSVKVGRILKDSSPIPCNKASGRNCIVAHDDAKLASPCIEFLVGHWALMGYPGILCQHLCKAPRQVRNLLLVTLWDRLHCFCGDRIDQWQVDIIHFARPQAMLPRCCGSSWGATHSAWRESASRSGIFFYTGPKEFRTFVGTQIFDISYTTQGNAI